MSSSQTIRWRTIFISDVHLGSRTAQPRALVDFLRCHDADTIYIVGDFVDFWRLKQRSHWPQEHNDVIQKLLRKARKGTRVVLIPGNHDEALDQFWGAQFGNLEVAESAVHKTADGRTLLVVHGDEFDGVVCFAKWFVALGDASYAAAIAANAAVNAARRMLGLGQWSLAAYLKVHFKQAIAFIENFEAALAQEARRRGFDGVVCGHVHHAGDKIIDGVHYFNCGDWVESCTAIVEDRDGRMRVVNWHAETAMRSRVATSLPRTSPTLAA